MSNNNITICVHRTDPRDVACCFFFDFLQKYSRNWHYILLCCISRQAGEPPPAGFCSVCYLMYRELQFDGILYILGVETRSFVAKAFLDSFSFNAEFNRCHRVSLGQLQLHLFAAAIPELLSHITSRAPGQPPPYFIDISSRIYLLLDAVVISFRSSEKATNVKYSFAFLIKSAVRFTIAVADIG